MLLQKNTILFCACATAVAFMSACRVDPQIPSHKADSPVSNIVFNVPEGWPQPVYSYQNNPLTENGFRLGRKLFYEVRLSRDNTISCGSCHQDFAAFAHSAHPLSHGIDGQFGIRNSPALFNLNWHPSLMLDGGVNHIEVQPLAPITNPVEMDETMDGVITKLSADVSYRAMFKDAFGDETINSQRMFRALAQFQGMLVSSNSRYDKYARGQPGGDFSAPELNGLAVFTAKCASCHKPPLFTDFSFRNNGLSVNTALKDSGRAHITGLPVDRYKFKVPSLRNVAVSSPYMHDGRFATLSQCLNHYNTGVKATENLDPALVSGIPLTAQEMQDLISFLGTLTDNTFLRDERFKDPN